ncbi:phage holin family protein, partial [Bacillus mycoides]|uniref:phage holin family protein n=1 Tax=Bacillus mycoides TaxID=1405 RepID=UPI002112B29A
AIREATIFFFMGNELLSLLENAGRMGIPLPQALTNAIKIFGANNQKTSSAYDTSTGDDQ